MGATRTISFGAIAGLLLVSSIARGNPNWSGGPYSFTIPTSISARGQSVSSSFPLQLVHDVPGCTVYFTAVGDDYNLKYGGNSLTTEYKLSGMCLVSPDSELPGADWRSAPAFVGKPYGVNGTGTDTVTLWVKGSDPGGTSLIPPGRYQATLTVVVSW